VVIWRKVVVTLLRRFLLTTGTAATLCTCAAGATGPLKVHVGIRAEFAVAAAGSVWTTNSLERRLVRIDPATNRVSARIKLRGSNPLGITYGAGSIWVANRNSGSVTRVNPKTNKAAKKRIKVGLSPYALAYGAGSIWVSNESSGTVSRINPRRNKVVKTIRVGGGPNGLVAAFGSIWATDYQLGHVIRIDPARNKVTARLALDHADWITPTADALWISSETNNVYRLDPQTLQITASVPVGQNPLASTLLGNELWVPNIDSNTVSVIDTTTATVTRTIPVGPQPIAVVQQAGDAWVTSAGDGDVWRLPPTAGRRSAGGTQGTAAAVRAVH
jgi:YVTN family beta-propeller protein